MTTKEEDAIIAPPTLTWKEQFPEVKADPKRVWPFPPRPNPYTSPISKSVINLDRPTPPSAQTSAPPSAPSLTPAGFFVAKKDFKYCKHPEHKVPSMIAIPQGQIYVHTCPKCKKQSYAESVDVSLNRPVL